MAGRRLLVLGAVLALLVAGCATPEDEVTELSLAIGDVPSSVGGNVVTLPVDVEGIEIRAADGDDSGDTGHFHVFIDREPVAVGQSIPVGEPDIVHSAENPVTLYGLPIGEHTFTVVVGDGTHRRIGEGVEDSVTVEVEGPTVDGTAPATIDEGEELVVGLSAEGVEIVAADGDDSGETGHLHVLVDPDDPPAAGDVIPPAEEGRIYHTAENSVTIEGLEAGAHTIWVVLGDGAHRAFDPPVMDRIAVTVG